MVRSLNGSLLRSPFRSRVSVREVKDGREIRISGDFEFHLFREFGDCFLDKKPLPTTVDLRATDKVSTAGLGMLLVLKDYCGAEVPVTLLIEDEAAAHLLALVNFKEKFQIRVGPDVGEA